MSLQTSVPEEMHRVFMNYEKFRRLKSNFAGNKLLDNALKFKNNGEQLIIINKKLLLIYSLNLQPEPIIHLMTAHCLGCKTFNFNEAYSATKNIVKHYMIQSRLLKHLELMC